MSLYKFKPDQSKREKGILVEADTSGDYVVTRVVKTVGKRPTFRLALATDKNPKWAKVNERNNRALREAEGRGEEPTVEQKNEVFLESMLEASLLGWHNVTDESGKELEFSIPAARKLLGDLEEVFLALARQAQLERNFRIDLPEPVEADAKNS